MRSAIREEECTVSRDVTRDEGDVILLGGKEGGYEQEKSEEISKKR